MLPAQTHRILLVLGGSKTRQTLRRTFGGKERGWVLAAVLSDTRPDKMDFPPRGLPVHDAVEFVPLWCPSRQSTPLEADAGWSIPSEEPPGTTCRYRCIVINASCTGATDVKPLLTEKEKRRSSFSQAGYCSILAFHLCKIPLCHAPLPRALLITAFLQKILSDREHTVVLYHPPLWKQESQIKPGGSYLAAPAISCHSQSALGFSWEQCWALPPPAAEGGTIPAKPRHQGPPSTATAPWKGAPGCRMDWGRAALPGVPLAGVPGRDDPVQFFQIVRHCPCSSVSLQRSHHCSSEKGK